VPLADLVRKHGISTASFYAWRKKYGGMEVCDAKKLRAVEDENRRLKKLVSHPCAHHPPSARTCHDGLRRVPTIMGVPNRSWQGGNASSIEPTPPIENAS
jgi:hypothetical protein